jgi:hypothetical protein
MDYYLLQSFYDTVVNYFENGKIDRTTFLKISYYLESNKQLFTININ